LLREPVANYSSASELPSFTGKTIQVYGYLVALKNSKSSKGQLISFAMFLDQEGEVVDTVHFHPSLALYPFSGSGIYFLEGKVVEEFGFCCIEVCVMKKQAFIEDPRFSEGII